MSEDENQKIQERWDKTIVTTVLEAYLAGNSIAWCSEKWGIPASTIYSWLHAAKEERAKWLEEAREICKEKYVKLFCLGTEKIQKFFQDIGEIREDEKNTAFENAKIIAEILKTLGTDDKSNVQIANVFTPPGHVDIEEIKKVLLNDPATNEFADPRVFQKDSSGST